MKFRKNQTGWVVCCMGLLIVSKVMAQREVHPKAVLPGTKFQSGLRNNFPPLDFSAYSDDRFFLSKERKRLFFSAQKSIDDMLNLVRGDSILKTIRDLQNFQSRYMYSEGINDARNYLFNKFQAYGQEVSGDAFTFNKNLILSFHLKGTGIAWMVGLNGLIIRSTDMGANWQVLSRDIKDDLCNIFFLDSLNGWCTGSYGKIYKTTDGGDNWAALETGTKSTLWGLSFIDTLNGWVCGNDELSKGIMLNTRDGGLSWKSSQGLSIPSHLYDIYFVTQDSGRAVGDNGYVASTDNGGLTWTEKKISSEVLYRIKFTDSRHGWIAGSASSLSGGVIYKTVNGGESWLKAESPGADASFQSVSFSDSLHGWAAGWSSDWKGRVIYSNDGGEHWLTKGSFDDLTLDVIAIDAVSCLAVGYYGRIYRTLDGGATWEEQMPAATQHSAENVVAVKRGVSKPDSIIVIGGHYDSFSDSGNAFDEAPGADDNGSGTAAVVEIARVLSQYPLPYSVEYVAFSAEELGLFGSDHYAKEAKASGKKIKLMFNFDMIGYMPAGKKLNVFIASGDEYKWPADLAAQTTRDYTLLIPNKAYTAINYQSDHVSFLNQGFPVLFFTEKGSNPYYHSVDDVDSTLNIPYAAEVVKAALATVASMCGMTNENGLAENGPIAGLPERMALHGNYPNPFNSTTIIRVSMPRSQQVELKVFDLLGREVAVPVNGLINEGHHDVHFDASGLPSGIYVYRIRTEGFTASRKMVVLE